MKKFFIITVITLLIVIGYSHDQFLWCKKMFMGEPTTHTIQKGEYLSIIAKKYYGNPDYWRELALINRAPNSNLVFPGEEIIIPSEKVIKEIRRTRWLSKVNNYIKDENDIIARLNKGEVIKLVESVPDTVQKAEPIISEPAQTETGDTELTQLAEDAETSPQESASLNLILIIVAAVFVVSLIALLIYRRKKSQETITVVGDDELNSDIDDSEPDYKEYLRGKSKNKKSNIMAN